METMLNTIKQTIKNSKIAKWSDKNFDNHYLWPQLFYIFGMVAFPLIIGAYLLYTNTLTEHVSAVFIIPYIMLLAGVVIIMRKDLKKDFSKKWDKKFFITVGILFCFVFFINEFGSQVLGSIITHINVETTTSENQQLFEALMKIASGSIGITALIGAVLEELVFRKAMMSFIKNRKVAIFVSTLTFASMHLSGFGVSEMIMFTLYLALGFIFSMIYEKTQDVRYGVCVHFLNNLVGVIQTIL